MSSNSSINMGNILSNRIRQGQKDAVNSNESSEHKKIANLRAGWQQRYGAMQLINVVPNQYAMFGGWANGSTTVGE